MAAIPAAIKKRIDTYLALLCENNIPLRSAYLFGSYARGTYNRWSDIDIALVSERFTGDRIEDKKLIRRITLQTGSDIEPLPFAPEDFTDADPMAHEIMTSGIRLI